MKRIKKWCLTIPFCVIFLLTISVNAMAAYSPSEAINYAKNHCASGHTSGGNNCPNSWLCAEFVSKCLQAGGMSNANKTGCRSLYNELCKYGTSYALTVDSNGYINVNRNVGKISVGDVIITHCNTHDLYLHAVLVSSIDGNGYVNNYSHNANKMNQKLTASRYCSKKGGNESYSNITAYVIHFSQPASNQDTTAPTISDVKITNVSNAGYTVQCTASDNVKIEKVLFPTWTESNGQDDLNWYTAEMMIGSPTQTTASRTINVTNHNNEGGTYITHIYAYDSAGNQSLYEVKVYIDRTNPVISNVRVTDVSESGYTVLCDVTDDTKVERVQFPTWTTYNGQDDIDSDWWAGAKSSGTLIDGNTYSFRVNRSDHNKELEDYVTNIYAFDSQGNNSSNGGVTVSCLLGNKIDLGSEFVASIQNIKSKTVLTNDNNNVSGRTYKANKNQKWLFMRQSNGNYQIVSMSDVSKCIDVYGASDANGTNVNVWTENKSKAQYWKIYGTAKQGYYFVPEFSRVQTLDLRGASSVEGTNIQIFECGGGESQRFSINYLSTSLNLNKTTINMKVGDSQKISAQIQPANVSDKNIIWSSSNPKVAKIKDGSVTAVSVGTTTITATTKDSLDGDNKITASCVVKVSKSGTSNDVAENHGNTKKEIKPKGTKITCKKQVYIVTSDKASRPTVAYSQLQNKNAKKIRIPNVIKVNGVQYKVTAIAANAFAGNDKLKEVTIGKNVTSIGEKAFAKCQNLKTIKIESKVVKKVAKNSFEGAKKTIKIRVPKNKLKSYQKIFKVKANAKIKLIK